MNVFMNMVALAWQHLITLSIAAVVLIGVVLTIVWWPKASIGGATESEVWTCCIYPQIRLPGPGSCSICGMMLIHTSRLKTGKDGASRHGRLGTTAVSRRELFKEFQTVGKSQGGSFMMN
jgi:hypothetical protein